mgnify:FL=1
MKKRTINDLPQDRSLGGVRLKNHNTGETCIYHSQWQKGIWYKKNEKDTQIFPIFLDDLREALKFELADI